MKTCSTCHWCQVIAKDQGFCHGAVPQVFHQQWLKVNGDLPPKIIAMAEGWTQLWPAGPHGQWPPVDPQLPGCANHKFSIRTWLAWFEAKPLPKPSTIEQQRS